MITTHNVRINIDDKPTLKRLIATGQLVPSRDSVSGLRGGQVYTPALGVATQLAPLNYHTLAIGNQLLRAQLFRLPEYELTALLEHHQAAGFKSYKLHKVLSMLMTGRRRDAKVSSLFVESMIEALSAGPQDGVLPLVDEKWVGGVWQPEATQIVLHKRLPFVSLGFELSTSRDDEDSNLRRPIGIDVGLNPLITYARKDNVTSSGTVFPVTVEEHRAITAGAAAQGISAAVVDQQIEILTYAAARALLEMHLVFIRSSASVVYIEKLDLTSFASDFVERGRSLAIIDFLSSWLPQQMRVEHVRVEAIDPEYTSLICAQCHLPGTRVGKIFICSGCDQIANSDENASQVLVSAGLAYTLRRHARRRK